MTEKDRPVAGAAGVEQPPATESAPASRPRRRSYFREHPRAKGALLFVLLVIAAVGTWLWWYYSGRESTDDAQVDGYITPLSARVGGTVIAVNFNDNDRVEAGKVLVQIDPRDYQVALDRARATLAQEQATAQAARSNVPITSTTTGSRTSTAEAGVEAAQAARQAAEKQVTAAEAQLNAAQARLRESEARNTLAQSDLARMKQLIGRDEISQQQYDSAVANANAAAATMAAAKAAVAQSEQAVPVAQSQVAQAVAALAQANAALRAAGTAPQQIQAIKAEASSAEARVKQAQAAVEQAELNLQYTTVRAPEAGVVNKRNVDVGQVISAGQPLAAVVLLSQLWVTANYKETQLKNMRVGQAARVWVDAFGGREFRGHVDSIAAATGARFSLLPPENATGNYVKVVQRVPVKIVLERDQDPERELRPGMSVETTVLTR